MSENKLAIGLQLYTLRDDMAADFEGTLRKAAALGYKGVEFAGYFGRSAESVRTLLDELGLTTIGSHVSLERIKTDLQGEIDYLKTIGGKYFICPYLQPQDYESEEKWKQLFTLFQQVGIEVSKQGLVFCYHNHAFEFESHVDGQFAFDALYGQTSPEAVQVELDVCWVQFAGQDPLAYIRKYSGRLPLLHLKDFTKGAEGNLITLELGKGDVSLKDVIAAATDAGVSWLVVEQDNCQIAPLDSIANSMNWLQLNYL